MVSVESNWSFKKGIQRKIVKHFGPYIDDIIDKFVGLEADGEENVSKDGPIVLTPRHQHMFDPFFITIPLLRSKLLYPTYLMAPYELRNIPLANRMLEFFGCLSFVLS